MSKKTFILIGLVIVGLIIYRLNGNYNKINSRQNVSTDLPRVSVTVDTVKSFSLEQDMECVGTLAPITEINIAAESQGGITSLPVRLGQRVQKGEILAKIDDKQKALSVEAARISLRKLEKDLQRYQNLYKGGTITEQQLDEMTSVRDNTVIQLQQMEKQLSDAVIRAPITGIISEKFAEEGAFINVGSPVVTIVNVDRFKINLNVSEEQVYVLIKGSPATIKIDIYPDVDFSGIVSFISPKGDAGHNYLVDVILNNSAHHSLKAGTFVTVRISLPASPKASYILREALQGTLQNAYVYVAEGGLALSRSVVVQSAGNKWLRIRKGLNPGEAVIIGGQVNLTDGKAIAIRT